jgi:hypothetical protein
LLVAVVVDTLAAVVAVLVVCNQQLAFHLQAELHIQQQLVLAVLVLPLVQEQRETTPI